MICTTMYDGRPTYYIVVYYWVVYIIMWYVNDVLLIERGNLPMCSFNKKHCAEHR